MIHIAFLFHIYQPPFQSYSVLTKIINESYIPVFEAIEESENAKVTLNINGSLTEMLNMYGFCDLFEKINQLSSSDKIRFTGSAMYHPILPLIPLDEIRTQVSFNEEYNRQIFKKYANSKGFFPPELCISPATLDFIEKEGYKWVIADGIACNLEWPTNNYYMYKNLPVFFRDSIISNQIAFKEITPANLITRLKTLFEEDYYVIFALDGETFGHHIKGYEESFLKAFFKLARSESNMEFVFIDDLLTLYKTGGPIQPRESSWSTSMNDIQNEVPYPLWANPTNQLHIIQNRLQNLVYELLKKIEDKNNSSEMNKQISAVYNTARDAFNKGLQSCKLWWSDPSHFDHNLIIYGNNFLVTAAINLFKVGMNIKLKNQDKIECRKIYKDIVAEFEYLLREIGTSIEYKYRFGHL